MASPDAVQQRGGRETRLLLVTIAVSIGVLLLLSRFRFPEQAAEPLATPAAAPLDRLAARAAYDELASTMADLERRLTGSIAVLAVQPHRESGGFVVAPRLTADRAAVLLRAGESLPGETPGTSRVIAADLARELAVVAVPPDPGAIVTPREGPPRAGPRYAVAIEGTADGLTLRPVYIGKTSTLQDERTATPMLVLAGLQSPVPQGSALFSLDGIFIGLVTGGGPVTTVLPADFLRATAERAVTGSQTTTARFGIEVDDLTEALRRATSASSGVIVTTVEKGGPAAGVLLPGDVVQTIDGMPTTNAGAFLALERSRTPATPSTVSIVRRGTPETLTIPASDAARGSAAGAEDETGIVGRAAAGEGIEIVAITPRSAAEQAGLVRGDVILTVNGRNAGALEELTRTFGTAKPGTAWVLTVQRGARAHAVALEKRRLSR